MMGLSAGDRSVVVGIEAHKRPPAIVSGRTRSCAVLVGAPHSGISVCARALRVLGVDFPDSWGADDPAQLSEVHDRILGLSARDYRTPLHDLLLPAAWWTDPRLRPVREQMASLVREPGATRSMFGLADLRLARLLPVWQEIFRDLDVTPKIVLCLRSPAHVARALAAAEGISTELGEYRWFTYMVDIFRSIDDGEVCVIEFENWFRDPLGNAEKLMTFLGLDWNQSQADLTDVLSGIVDPQRRGDNLQETGARQPIVRSLYEQLRRGVEDPAAREAIAATVNAFVQYRQLSRPIERAFEGLSERAEGPARSQAEQTPEQSAAPPADPGEASDDTAGPAAESEPAPERRQEPAGEGLALRAVTASDAARGEASAVERRASSPARPKLWQRLWRGFDRFAGRDRSRRAEIERAEIERAEIERAEIESRLTILEAALAEHENAMADAVVQAEASASQLEEARAARAEAEREVAQAEARTAGERASLAAVEAEIAKLRTTLADRDQVLAERERAVAEARDHAEHMAGRLRHAEVEREEEEAVLDRIRQAAAASERRAEEGEAAASALRAELAGRDTALAEANERAKAAGEALSDARGELDDAQTKAAIFERDAEEQRAAVAEAEAAAARLQQELAERERALSDAAEQAEAAEAALRATSAELEDIRAKAAIFEQDAEEQRAAVAGAEAAAAGLRQEMAGRERAVSEANARTEAAAAALRKARGEIEEMEAKLAAVRQEADEQRAAAEGAEATAARLQQELAERERAVSEANAQTEEACETARKARDEIEEIEATLAAARQDAEEQRALAAAADRHLSEVEAQLHEAAAAHRRLSEVEAQLREAAAERDAAQARSEQLSAKFKEASQRAEGELVALRKELYARNVELAASRSENAEKLAEANRQAEAMAARLAAVETALGETRSALAVATASVPARVNSGEAGRGQLAVQGATGNAGVVRIDPRRRATPDGSSGAAIVGFTSAAE